MFILRYIEIYYNSFYVGVWINFLSATRAMDMFKKLTWMPSMKLVKVLTVFIWKQISLQSSLLLFAAWTFYPILTNKSNSTSLSLIYVKKNFWWRLMLGTTIFFGTERFILWISESTLTIFIWNPFDDQKINDPFHPGIYNVKGCGMGPCLVLVSPCFRENILATCKIGSFLCSLDNLLQKNVIVLFFGN